MTVRQSKEKKRIAFIVTSLVIILLGIAAFVLSYGLSKGWDVVAAWFSGKYAILLYIFLGCYALVIIGVLLWDEVNKL